VIGRREWIGSTAWWLASTWAAKSGSAFFQTPKFSDNPFALGVASGDPLPTSVALWTRLMGDGLRDNVQVIWELSDDDQMHNVLKHGTVAARPDFAHSVHVEVDGLEPARWYFYRFRAGGVASPIGRTRTAPKPGTKLERLNFAFASCQNFADGYYTAYEHMVKEDIELVLFLGDYIYENGKRNNRVRQHSSEEIHTLDEYRARYAQYKSDPLLQEAHRLFPWIAVWDDHEVANNWAGDWPQWSSPDPDFMKRRANAAKAYYEHMPFRRASLPKGPNMQVFRRFDYGDLMRLHMVDTRQFRSRQACDDGIKYCTEVDYGNRTMFGTYQEQWLNYGLDQSTARWNVIGNQVMMTRADMKLGPGEEFQMDNWSGYEAARRRFMEYLAFREPSGPLVITGDAHHNLVGDMRIDYRSTNQKPVATELVGSSITSGGDYNPRDTFALRWEACRGENPQVRYFLQKRGYVVCSLDRELCHTAFRSIDRVSVPGEPLLTSARFVIENRKAGATRVSDMSPNRNGIL
jgi:alkaline phosphatase D